MRLQDYGEGTGLRDNKREESGARTGNEPSGSVTNPCQLTGQTRPRYYTCFVLSLEVNNPQHFSAVHPPRSPDTEAGDVDQPTKSRRWKDMNRRSCLYGDSPNRAIFALASL